MSFWVWAPTRAIRVTSRDLQKRTNLSSLAMEVCLSILKLQSWLLGFTYTAKTSSEDVFIPGCWVWAALLCTAQHPKPLQEMSYKLHKLHIAAQWRDVPYRNAWCQFFLLPLSAHCLPSLQPLFLQHFSLLSLFTKLQTSFSPCTRGSTDGSSSSHSS